MALHGSLISATQRNNALLRGLCLSRSPWIAHLSYAEKQRLASRLMFVSLSMDRSTDLETNAWIFKIGDSKNFLKLIEFVTFL